MNNTLKITILSLLILSSCAKKPDSIYIQPDVETDKTTETTETTNADVATGELTADFQPTQGGFDKDGEGPWKMRMLLATSKDGLNFTKTNVIFADQANTPSIAVDKNGWIYIYYSGYALGDKTNSAGVGISKDNGETWTHKYVNVLYKGEVKSGTDPDIEILEDGTFRLFFISKDLKISQTPQIYYADGTNGYDFTYGGVSFEENGDAIDPSTFKIADVWHQFTLVGKTMSHYHATSQDGITFTLYKKENFNFESGTYVMANEIQVEGGVRFYAFDLQNSSFRSISSSDGYNWKMEEGAQLTFDKNSSLESKYIKDPAVGKLSDGSYIMAYVTVIPE